MPLRKNFLKQAQKRLEGMKSDVLADIREDLQKGREGQKDDGLDAYDVASEERDREISFLLTDRDRGKLQAIEAALERMDEGSYGMCDMCESDISPERLEVMPFTRLCVQCQSDQEDEARQMRRPDDAGAYRRLSSLDLDEDS